MRIRCINQVSPKVKKVLQLFCLRQINNDVFIRLNRATISMVRICEPYITLGTPNLKSVCELIYKCGHVKVAGNRTLLRFYSDLTSAKCHEPVQLSPQFPLIRQVFKEAEMLNEFLADPSKFAAVIRTWANETPKASSLVRCG